jgi:CRISPR-associated protein Csm2
MPQGSSGQFRGGRQSHGGADRRTSNQPPPPLIFAEVVLVPAGKLRDGGKVDPKLYSDIAERAARSVGQDRSKNKPAQLRRFYDELVLLHDKVMREPKRFEEQLPFINMLKAKVAYANGREKVDENYRSLLCRVVDQTVDVETLGQGRLFMEAFVAYYKIYRPSEA